MVQVHHDEKVANRIGPEFMRRCPRYHGQDNANTRRVFISGQKRGVFGTIEREPDVARQSSP